MDTNYVLSSTTRQKCQARRPGPVRTAPGRIAGAVELGRGYLDGGRSRQVKDGQLQAEVCKDEDLIIFRTAERDRGDLGRSRRRIGDLCGEL